LKFVKVIKFIRKGDLALKLLRQLKDQIFGFAGILNFETVISGLSMVHI